MMLMGKLAVSSPEDGKACSIEQEWASGVAPGNNEIMGSSQKGSDKMSQPRGSMGVSNLGNVIPKKISRRPLL